MKNSSAIVIAIVCAIVCAAAAVGAALIVRDGLLAVAASIRDKPLPELPDAVTVSELTIEHATIQHQPPGDGDAPGVSLTIENMRIDAPVTQPPSQ